MNASNIITLTTIVLSSIVTIISLLLPHIATFIKLHQKTKLYFEKRKIDTLEKYIESAFGFDTKYDFYKLNGTIHMYIDPSEWHILDKIYTARKNDDYEQVHSLMAVLLSNISMKESKKLFIPSKNRQNSKNRNK